MTTKNKVDKFQTITDQIVESLENGHIPWKKPWVCSIPKNLKTNKEYRGINHLMLSMIPSKYPYFATFNQIKELGGTVLKGSKSIPIYFYSPIVKQEKILVDGNNGNEEIDFKEKSFWIIKQYQVFSMEQVDGIDLSQFIDPELDFKPALNAEKLIESYFQNDLMPIIYGGSRAYYILGKHEIHLPSRGSFKSEAEFYSTCFHEMIHSTGHKERTNRHEKLKIEDIPEYHTQNEQYAYEELVAELGASMLASYTGVDTSESFTNSKGYIQSWIKHLKNDKHLIYRASSKAQEAVDYILKKSGFEIFNSDETNNQINEAV